jgi:hypothetical protein
MVGVAFAEPEYLKFARHLPQRDLALLRNSLRWGQSGASLILCVDSWIDHFRVPALHGDE